MLPPQAPVATMVRSALTVRMSATVAAMILCQSSLPDRSQG